MEDHALIVFGMQRGMHGFGCDLFGAGADEAPESFTEFVVIKTVGSDSGHQGSETYDYKITRPSSLIEFSNL